MIPFKPFNIENVAIPPHLVLKLLLVEAHDSIINAIEDYYKQISRGNGQGVEHIKSRLISYFFRVKSSLYANESKRVKKLERENLPIKYNVEQIQEELLTTEDINVLLSIFDYINSFLYNKGVLKFETTIKYDETDAEQSNQIRGFG